MKINEKISDKAMLQEIGKRMQALRISNNFTQAGLAKKTGVSLSSIARMEQGNSIQTDTLLVLMRELNIIENLEIAFPQQEMSPMDMLNFKGKKRKRASKQKQIDKTDNWKWGDEK